MKVLLDENLDHRLLDHLHPHEVFTVSYMGWSGLKNGKPLQAAEDDGFEVLVTGDRTPGYEQNLAMRKIAVVALSSIEWRIIRDHLSLILAAVDHAWLGTFQAVDCGTFDRRRSTDSQRFRIVELRPLLARRRVERRIAS